jgi:hypothetical protein
MLCSVKWLGNSTRTAIALVSILVGGVCSTFAQGFTSGQLVPSKVYMNTEMGPLYVNDGDPYIAAFVPTAITCPASRPDGCTLRVETSLQVTGAPVGGQLYVRVRAINKIAGTQAPYAYPNSVISVDQASRLGWTTHTFQWMVMKVAAGATVTVNVDLLSVDGNVEANDRTETIELLFN